MLRLRISAAMKKEFAGLRDSNGTLRRGGVMKVPRIATDLDAWSAMAEASQAELLAATAEDRQPYTSAPAPTKEPDDAAIQREHERLYQEHRAKAAEGGLSLVRANERRVRKETMR